MDVTETDKEIVVEAELPGIDEKDVSLALQDGILTIRGERKHARDEENSCSRKIRAEAVCLLRQTTMLRSLMGQRAREGANCSSALQTPPPANTK